MLKCAGSKPPKPKKKKKNPNPEYGHNAFTEIGSPHSSKSWDSADSCLTHPSADKVSAGTKQANSIKNLSVGAFEAPKRS